MPLWPFSDLSQPAARWKYPIREWITVSSTRPELRLCDNVCRVSCVSVLCGQRAGQSSTHVQSL